MLIKQLYKIKDKVKKTLNNSLIKSMATVAIITFLIKVIAFYKETIIAGTFGLSDVLDTFLIAVLIPTFIQSVFLNSLKNLFIPNYIAEIKNGGNKASFQTIVFLMTIVVCSLSIVFAYFFIDLFLEIIYPNHTVAYYNLVKHQLVIILPGLFFAGFGAVISGLLEVNNKFLISTIAGLFPLLTMILFLVYLKAYLGDMVLAYGTFTGSAIGFLFLVVFALKNKNLALGSPVLNDNVKLMIGQLPPKISSSFLSAMNNFIDQFFAGSLVVGSIAALNYGNRVPAFGVTIVIMAMGSVLLPHFSRLVNEDIKSAYHYLFKTLKLVISVGIIVVLIAVFFSDWIIEMWLERDNFTHEDTIKVSTIQKILLLNIPFYICTLIIVKFLTSINKNKFMAWISFFNLLVNILLNIIFIKYYGVFGLAVSTSLVLIISSCFYFGYTYRQYKNLSL